MGLFMSAMSSQQSPATHGIAFVSFLASRFSFRPCAHRSRWSLAVLPRQHLSAHVRRSLQSLAGSFAHSDSTTITVANAFVTGWIALFGVPSVITTDRGAQFESSFFKQLLHLLSSCHSRTASYHLQANSLVERFHRHLKVCLRANPQPSAWISALPIAAWHSRCLLRGSWLQFRRTGLRYNYAFTSGNLLSQSILCSISAVRLIPSRFPLFIQATGCCYPYFSSSYLHLQRFDHVRLRLPPYRRRPQTPPTSILWPVSCASPFS